jgi:hypothetical protein
LKLVVVVVVVVVVMAESYPDVLETLDQLEGLRDQLSKMPNTAEPLPEEDSDEDEEESSDDDDNLSVSKLSEIRKKTDVRAKKRAAANPKKRKPSSQASSRASSPALSEISEQGTTKKKGRPKGSKNKSKKSPPSGGKPPLPPKSNSGPKQKRDPYMSYKEDVALCRAYVNTSENPIFGSNQTGDAFWVAVSTTFNKIAKTDKDIEVYVLRDATALRNRFQRLVLPQMNIYNRFWREAHAKKISGWTADDYIRKADELFEEYTGKPFNHSECVKILHVMPKFDPSFASNDDAPEDDIAMVGNDSDATASRVNNVGHVQGAGKIRPQGNKSAKRAKYYPSDSSGSNSEHTALLRDLHKATTQLSKTIQNKAAQESDINLAMLNYKMGKQVESQYHLDCAAMRSERWRAKEAKEEQKQEEDKDKVDEEKNNEENEEDDD